MSKNRSNDELKRLLEALSATLSDEELLLSTLQADIAATITSKRVSSGLSQKELAEKLNVSQALVSKWEQGETNFTLETLVRLAIKLDIKMRSPFLSEPPYRYQGTAKIISLPQWKAAAAKNGSWTTESNSAQNYELKEM